MVEDTSLSQDTVEINGNVVHKIVSYDKDVVEITLPDTIDSDKYGGNFVKDVCIDEGTIFHPKILEEKPIDRRPSPKVSYQMNEANSDLVYSKQDDDRESVNLKPETILPADLDHVPSKNGKQYSTGEDYDHDDGITADCIAGDPSDKKISLQELLLLESAEESRLASTKNCESTGKQQPHEDAAGQAPINGSHDIQTIVHEISDHVSSGISSTMSADEGAALDMKKPNQIDRHNLFIDHRSLVVEGISEPACSIPEIPDDSSTEPICTVSQTDSSNVVSSSTGLIEVGTAESGLDAESSHNLDIRLSEENNDASEILAGKEIAERVDETAFATSSPPNNAEHSDLNGKNQEKCDVSDFHDFNQIEEQNGLDTHNVVSKTPDSVIVQTEPESSRSTTGAGTGNGDAYESNFFGPSIMSDHVSHSDHIAYPGNISLRSDSSTTSTRSFAFPVLQREWISSPVRMAKAERRRHLGWRKGLICCKF